MENMWVLVFGLVVLLLPLGLFGWSTLTKRGRKAYERNIRDAEQWPKMGGLIPLKPPKSAAARRAYSHPWPAAGVVAFAEACAIYLVSRLVVNDDHGEATGDAIFFGLEGFVILGLIFRQFSKHYGKSTEES